MEEGEGTSGSEVEEMTGWDGGSALTMVSKKNYCSDIILGLQIRSDCAENDSHVDVLVRKNTRIYTMLTRRMFPY